MRRIQFFVPFRSNQELNFKVLLKVPKVVFRFLEQKLLAFCEINLTHLHSMTKYCQKLFNVFAGEIKTLHSFFSNPPFL